MKTILHLNYLIEKNDGSEFTDEQVSEITKDIIEAIKKHGCSMYGKSESITDEEP